MPRLHPTYYHGNEADMQLTTAFCEGDPSAAWALMKAGLATPTADNLDNVMHGGYREGCYRHVGTTAPVLEEDPLPLDETLVYGQPATAKAHARSQVRLANMLFAHNISPLQSYPVSGNMGTGHSILYTNAAQEAFAIETHTKPNMALLSLIVLQALKEKPTWKPDIGHIFRNTLEQSDEEEAVSRQIKAAHVSKLGLLVGSRLKNMPLAKTGLSNEQLSWWTDSKTWNITPATQPTPTEVMRTSYREERSEQSKRMMDALRRRGAFDAPAGS